MTNGTDDLGFEPRKGGTGRYILIGCLTFVIIGLVGLGVGGWFVASNWKTWAADATTSLMATGIRDTQLTNEQKRELIARIEGMGEEFKADRLTLEDLQKIGQTLQESPVLPVAVVQGMNAAYIGPSGLSDEDKQRAYRINDRIARGVFEERIELEELEPVLEPLSKEGDANVRITTNDEGATTGFRMDLKQPEQVTTEELLEYMANAESLLEQKGIPDEPFEVDVIEEFDRVIEDALGRRITPIYEGGG